MKVNQVYEILNTITAEVLGESVIVKEDLSNVVDVGKAFANLENGYDNYVRKLHDQIAKIVFSNRVYSGRLPSLYMDAWEWGSIVEKVRMDMPEAEENESWNLEDRASYDVNVFYKPTINATFFNNRVTFEVPISITEKQVKSAFSNATQLNAFYSMIQTAVENSMTVKIDSLIMRTVNAGIAETIYNEYTGGADTYDDTSGIRAVNLLYLYNDMVGAGHTITASAAPTDAGFLRFASYTIKNYIGYMHGMSTLFNTAGAERFTPEDRMHVVMLDQFKNAVGAYLYDGLNQFGTENIKFPDVETVPYWQGSGTDLAFNNVSKISVTTPSGHDVALSGILCCIFDRDTLGIANLNRRTTTNYNAKAEFWNEYHKAEFGAFLDMSENMVVFFIA